MHIEYKINAPVTTEQFIALLHASTLGERRPINNRRCMAGMLDNSNLTVTAWVNNNLIGIARNLTDFHYACYVSDLAVDTHYQRQGTGKKLLALTRSQLGPECKLILIAAPAANSYYQHLGFTSKPGCWVLESDQRLENQDNASMIQSIHDR